MTKRNETAPKLRRRKIVEIYIELSMQALGPVWPCIKPAPPRTLKRLLAEAEARLGADIQQEYGEFSAKTLLAAYRRGLLDEERWKRMRSAKRPSTWCVEWYSEFCAVYQALTGRELLLAGGGCCRLKQVIALLPLVRRLYEDPGLTVQALEEEEQRKAERDRREAKRWLKERFGYDYDDDRHGGRYGYLPGQRERIADAEPETNQEPENPEQIPHASQAHIDAVAAELLFGIAVNL